MVELDPKFKKSLEIVVGSITHDPASASYYFKLEDKEYIFRYDAVSDKYVVMAKPKTEKTLEQLRAEMEEIYNKPRGEEMTTQMDEKELRRIIDLEHGR